MPSKAEVAAASTDTGIASEEAAAPGAQSHGAQPLANGHVAGQEDAAANLLPGSESANGGVAAASSSKAAAPASAAPHASRPALAHDGQIKHGTSCAHARTSMRHTMIVCILWRWA